jgi:hypothetical protein
VFIPGAFVVDFYATHNAKLLRKDVIKLGAVFVVHVDCMRCLGAVYIHGHYTGIKTVLSQLATATVNISPDCV